MLMSVFFGIKRFVIHTIMIRTILLCIFMQLSLLISLLLIYMNDYDYYQMPGMVSIYEY